MVFGSSSSSSSSSSLWPTWWSCLFLIIIVIAFVLAAIVCVMHSILKRCALSNGFVRFFFLAICLLFFTSILCVFYVYLLNNNLAFSCSVRIHCTENRCIFLMSFRIFMQRSEIFRFELSAEWVSGSDRIESVGIRSNPMIEITDGTFTAGGTLTI